MRKEVRNRGPSDQFGPLREIEEFYDPLQPIKPIQEFKPLSTNACIKLFDDEDDDYSPFD